VTFWRPLVLEDLEVLLRQAEVLGSHLRFAVRKVRTEDLAPNAARAETPLRHALERRPDRVNGYRHLVLMLWREGRLEEAAAVLESATRQQFSSGIATPSA
jgi:hypothetical protein